MDLLFKMAAAGVVRSHAARPGPAREPEPYMGRTNYLRLAAGSRQYLRTIPLGGWLQPDKLVLLYTL
jgi:predicted secreted protein